MPATLSKVLPLNEPQRRAVCHEGGPLLVLAGPGSGKTRVVTARIARLIGRGIPARNVLAVTFTNKAAREMRDRVRAQVGRAATGLVISTFHSACVRVLREEIHALGYSKTFSIYDESSQHALLRTILRDLRPPEGQGSPSALLSGFERMRSRATSDAATPSSAPDEAHAFAVTAKLRYEEELRARNAVDFDDLLLLTARLFRERPDVLTRWRDRWQHVLVDEYQDTNPAQDEILNLLCDGHRNLCVVGDDDQSIYGWRGADVDQVLHFQRRYPDTTVVTLEQNYRSTGRIVSAANAVVARNAHRHVKTIFTDLGPGEPVRHAELEDDADEADFLAQSLAAEVHAPGADPWAAGALHAVLLRTNEQARPIEQALRRARVPYRLLGGRSLFDRKEVQDVIAYLRIAGNPDDEDALFRVVNTPSRGLGPAAVQAIRAESLRAATNTWATLCRVARSELALDGLSPRATESVGEFVRVVEDLAHAGALRSPTLVHDLLVSVRYEAEIERTYRDIETRVSRLNLAREVQKAWEAYLADSPKPTLHDFIDALTLGDRDDDRGNDRGVTLSTVHAAKGLEFECVWVAGCEEGLFPHARSVEDGRSLEEERRLFYVAITRAGRRLFLTRAKTRAVRGQVVETVPSRFLSELPEDCVEERDTNEPASVDSAAAAVERMKALLRRDAASSQLP